jgi:hypothetical protein
MWVRVGISSGVDQINLESSTIINYTVYITLTLHVDRSIYHQILSFCINREGIPPYL